MKTCVFAGTFDPPTKGHLDVLEKSLEIFDHVVVAIMINPEKKPFFNQSERKKLMEKMLEDYENVEVVLYGGMLVNLLKDYDTKFYVRGIRNTDDYKYETTMHYYNHDMYEDIITIFIPTPQDLSYVSSSALRELISMDADFSHYVPSSIYEDLKKLVKLKKNG